MSCAAVSCSSATWRFKKKECRTCYICQREQVHAVSYSHMNANIQANEHPPSWQSLSESFYSLVNGLNVALCSKPICFKEQRRLCWNANKAGANQTNGGRCLTAARLPSEKRLTSFAAQPWPSCPQAPHLCLDKGSTECEVNVWVPVSPVQRLPGDSWVAEQTSVQDSEEVWGNTC